VAPSLGEPAATSAAAAAPIVQSAEACREALKKRDNKAVTDSCEAALDSDASLVRPLLAFAKAQFERGRSAVAATWARKVLQIDDSLADAYLILGAAEQEARRPAAARTAYQRYLELAPRGAYANDVRSSLKSL
jgi:Flp pilus assembly protein TadD